MKVYASGGNGSFYNLTSPKGSHGTRKASQSMSWDSLGVTFTHNPQGQIALSLPFVPAASKTNGVAFWCTRDLNTVSDLTADDYFNNPAWKKTF